MKHMHRLRFAFAISIVAHATAILLIAQCPSSTIPQDELPHSPAVAIDLLINYREPSLPPERDGVPGGAPPQEIRSAEERDTSSRSVAEPPHEDGTDPIDLLAKVDVGGRSNYARKDDIPEVGGAPLANQALTLLPNVSGLGISMAQTSEETVDAGSGAVNGSPDEEIIGRRVGEWLKKAASQRKLELGLVHPFYTRLREHVRLETEKQLTGPGDLATVLGGLLLSSDVREEDRGLRRNNEAEFLVERHGSDSAGQAASRRAEEAAGALRSWASGDSRQKLSALVEIQVTPTTEFHSAILIKSSGNSDFDREALVAAKRAALAAQSAANAHQVAESKMPLRSRWAFEGRLSFITTKSLSSIDMRDLATIAGMSLVGSLIPGFSSTDGGALATPGLGTGYFDEVSGQIQYVDPTRPALKTTVTLQSTD